MLYDINDIVLIRSWDDMRDEYGLDADGDIPLESGYYFSEYRNLCETECKILDIDKSAKDYEVELQDGRTAWLNECVFTCAVNVVMEMSDVVVSITFDDLFRVEE